MAEVWRLEIGGMKMAEVWRLEIGGMKMAEVWRLEIELCSATSHFLLNFKLNLVSLILISSNLNIFWLDCVGPTSGYNKT